MTPTLIERIESATADEQHLCMINAFTAIHGKSPEWFDWYGEDENLTEIARKFARMLDAEAYESAAIMLVPENHRARINIYEDARAAACCYSPLDDVPEWGKLFTTPALAICAAALRVRMNP